jgi:hypothetical protein
MALSMEEPRLNSMNLIGHIMLNSAIKANDR